MRVFLLRMVGAKNSRKRRVAWSPASALIVGTTMLPVGNSTAVDGIRGTIWLMGSVMILVVT